MQLPQNVYTRVLALVVFLATVALQPVYGAQRWYEGLVALAMVLGVYHLPPSPPPVK